MESHNNYDKPGKLNRDSTYSLKYIKYQNIIFGQIQSTSDPRSDHVSHHRCVKGTK